MNHLRILPVMLLALWLAVAAGRTAPIETPDYYVLAPAHETTVEECIQAAIAAHEAASWVLSWQRHLINTSESDAYTACTDQTCRDAVVAAWNALLAANRDAQALLDSMLMDSIGVCFSDPESGNGGWGEN